MHDLTHAKINVLTKCLIYILLADPMVQWLRLPTANPAAFEPNFQLISFHVPTINAGAVIKIQ
jgi:hypothetical protein